MVWSALVPPFEDPLWSKNLLRAPVRTKMPAFRIYPILNGFYGSPVRAGRFLFDCGLFCFRRFGLSQSARLVKRKKISLKTRIIPSRTQYFPSSLVFHFHYSLDKPLRAL